MDNEDNSELIDNLMKNYDQQITNLKKTHEKQIKQLHGQYMFKLKHYEEQLMNKSKCIAEMEVKYSVDEKKTKKMIKVMECRISELLYEQTDLVKLLQDQKKLNQRLQTAIQDKSLEIQSLKDANRQLQQVFREIYQQQQGIQGVNQQREEDRGNCKVCYFSPATIAFVECGHLCLCKQCGKQMQGFKCPICKKKSRQQQIYSSMIKQE